MLISSLKSDSNEETIKCFFFPSLSALAVQYDSRINFQNKILSYTFTTCIIIILYYYTIIIVKFEKLTQEIKK